jgi:hypothetical protein
MQSEKSQLRATCNCCDLYATKKNLPLEKILIMTHMQPAKITVTTHMQLEKISNNYNSIVWIYFLATTHVSFFF